jgi:hypothetical protein
MKKRYSYQVHGRGAEDQTWFTRGVLTAEAEGNFPEMPGLALRESFAQLTNGKAVFGQPGVGCKGPYRVTKMVIELMSDNDKVVTAFRKN